ncbi:hypothetical protein WDW89_03425 [Deltaproteobacteria bacterium TL4]
MKRRKSRPNVSLFPFLSVLLCTMGILAFMSITFLLLGHKEQPSRAIRNVTFQWVGAPVYVKPFFIRCQNNEITYYDIFGSKEYTLSSEDLMQELQGTKNQIKQYLLKVALYNQKIKRSFGLTEHYPLLLVYPDGILATEILMPIIEQINGLNVGIEPMLPHWKLPYQSP